MLPTIPTPDELLDKGFRRGKKAADLRRGEKMPKHLKGKRIEETRVITACQVIKDRLKMILDRTPEIEERSREHCHNFRFSGRFACHYTR